MGIFDNIFGSPDPEKLKAKLDFEGLVKLRAIPQLIFLLNDSDLKIRLRALNCLAIINDKSSINPIVKMLKVGTNASGSVQVRKRAADILDQMGWKAESVEDKMLYYLSKDQFDLIPGLGADVIELLLKACEEKLIPKSRFSDMIKKFDFPEATEPLIEVLKYGIRKNDNQFRIPTIFVLIKIGEPVIEPLNRALGAAIKNGDDAFADGGALTILANIAAEKRKSSI